MTQLEQLGPKGKLEIAVNLAVLVAALVVTGYFVSLFVTRGASARPPSGVAPGTRLALPVAYDFKAHERTLILAIQDGCSYCEASMPFYVELSSRVDRACSKYGLVAALPNPPATAHSLLSRFHLPVPALPNTPLTSLGVTGTPTLLLVDPLGTVINVWVGELSREDEHEVLSALDPAMACGQSTGTTTGSP